jgi:rhodanese-related sulfurtransferase
MFFNSSDISQLSADQFAEKIEAESAVLLDVRTPQEFQQAHIDGAQLIDIHQPDFQQKIDELPRDRTYLIYCRSGHRSAVACRMMASMGFEDVHNLQKGIIDWVHHQPIVQPNTD